jgi:DNA helicase II / ATP-dependent DNA helicase PcrA
VSIALTAAQLAAVSSTAPKLCILACAGSGKTTTLTNRIAHHINERKIPGKSIAAITFTVLAADNLRIQLAELITDKQALSETFIGTIHGFCLQLLRDADPLMGDQYEVLSQDQQFVLLNLHFSNWDIQKIAPDLNKSELISRLIKTFDVAKLERLDWNHIAQFHPEVAHVASSYQSFVNQEHYFDFGDLLLQTVTRLEADGQFRSMVLERYHHLFVDEYQDVDPLQERLISLVSSTAELTVVGDDDQAIYQFRGTDVRNIRNLAARLPPHDVIVLSENRRCANNITQFSKTVADRIPGRIAKPLSAIRPSGFVTPRRFATVQDEANFIAGQIETSRKEYGSYNQIAILMRSVASYGDVYLDALRARGIPFVCKGDKGLFTRPEIQLLTGSLEVICKEPLYIEHLQELSAGIGVNLDTLNGDQRSVSLLGHADLQGLGFSEAQIEHLSRVLEVRDRYLAGKFSSTLDAVLATVAALRLLDPGADKSQHYNVCRLTQIVGDFDAIERTKRLHRLCAYFRMYAHAQFDEAVPLDPATDAVHVLTIHQAKGLEYSAVFLPMIVRRRFPVENDARNWLIDTKLFDAQRYITDLDDERRLFYVAVTRARDQLFLSCSANVGLKNPVAPSLFFDEAKAFVPPESEKIPHGERRAGSDRSPMVTSHSTLEYFLTCPYRYLLLREYGLATPTNPFFSVGRALHIVTRLIHERQVLGNPVSEAEAEALFLQHLGDTRGIPPYVLKRRTTSVIRAIKEYLAKRQDWIGSTVEVERPFDYAVPGAVVRGRIDLIVNRAEGGVSIVDWKTGRSHEYLRPDFQVHLYMLAAREQLGLDVRSAILHYIEEARSVEYPADPTKLAFAKGTLVSCIEKIETKQFGATPGSVCTRCECRPLCPFRYEGEEDA